MKFHKTILTLLAAMLAVIGTTVAVVQADGLEEEQSVQIHELLRRLIEAEDPQSEWARMSAQEQTALRNMEIDRIESVHTYGAISVPGSSGAMGASTSCWYRQQKKTGYHWPFKVWSYYQRVEWCGDGSKLTSTPHRSRWGETHMPFWSFVGHIGGSTSGGKGDWSFSASTQGKFSVCFPEETCLYSYTPWLNITVYANGTYSG